MELELHVIIENYTSEAGQHTEHIKRISTYHNSIL